MRDRERIRERRSWKVEPRTVVALAALGVAGVGAAFAAGWLMSDRLDAGGGGPDVPALAALDNVATESTAPKDEHRYSFHEELTAHDGDETRRKVFRAAPAPAEPRPHRDPDGDKAEPDDETVLKLLGKLAEMAPSRGDHARTLPTGPGDVPLLPAAPVTAAPVAATAGLEMEMTRPLADRAAAEVAVTAAPVPAMIPAVEPTPALSGLTSTDAADAEPVPPLERGGVGEAAAAPTPVAAPAPRVVPATLAPGKRFTIQVGSYPVEEEAEALHAELMARGYAPYTLAADVPGRGRWYRVRVGDFARREEAMAVKADIDAFAIEPSFVTIR